jgi:hypothetical protein
MWHEVWWIMVIEVHANYNAKEPADLGHLPHATMHPRSHLALTAVSR